MGVIVIKSIFSSGFIIQGALIVTIDHFFFTFSMPTQWGHSAGLQNAGISGLCKRASKSPSVPYDPGVGMTEK